MAVAWGSVLGSGRSRGSGGFDVTFQGYREVAAMLDEIEDGLKRTETRNLRQAAKQIAADVVIPQLLRAARSSPVPQARAMAATARPKSDRLVMVQVGGVNPALTGFKRGVGAARAKGKNAQGRAASSRTWRTTLAWGSELGPWPGGRAPRRVQGGRGAAVNHYRVERSSGGYWVGPGVTNAMPAAREKYTEAINTIILRSSRYR